MAKSTKRMKLKPRTQAATESPTEGANTGDVPLTNATVIANMEAGMKQRATLTRNVICRRVLVEVRKWIKDS